MHTQPCVPFSTARLPRILFGRGRIREVPREVAAWGRRVLLVTGAHSFQATSHWPTLTREMHELGLNWHHLTVATEPSPALVDDAVAQYHDAGIEVVLGIGGGSALDAAKAVAGLLPSGRSVLDFLEGVGRGLPYQGPALPFVAVPTTAGTGSEATKNAVLSQVGINGFKKSFRDEALVPQVAVVDAELLTGCPRGLLIANAMDAFAQLLESFVSAKANPLTDALAWSGMAAFQEGFFAALHDSDDTAATGRDRLAYGALISGITLAQAGLGSIHGLAGPLGALFPIPHGVACGTLLAQATAINIRALRERQPQHPALHKYARVAALLAGNRDTLPAEQLPEQLADWVQRLELPGLDAFGMKDADIPRVLAMCRSGSMLTNPLVLTDTELAQLLEHRLHA